MTPNDFRTLLDYHGLTQTAFAKLANVNPRLVRRYCDLRRAHPLPLGFEARVRMAETEYRHTFPMPETW
jgi:RNase adaptor protein for sRNA GlmZ degradation